ncbi:MAG: homocysteine S-methyltransferase family protein [Deltaproteobacteria bacterium]|nr:homocysteine S-methyltransferase family protein [Deltaproteobacteria bacterium]
MDIRKILDDHNFVLTEAAVIESIRRAGETNLHPRLGNALLIYDEVGSSALSRLYHDFISIAHRADVPITLGTPTWRANHERLSEANIQRDVIGDSVKFLNSLREEWGSWKDKIIIGGIIGCKNDSYRPNEGLSKEDARAFHHWQIDRLTQAGVDFLLAATLPALPEAAGIALAMERTAIPYILSFVINRDGCILDGTGLERAFGEIDAACATPPLGYMINCSYPSFLNAEELPEAVLSRLIGYQANASSLDHADLDETGELHANDISDWGERMIELNRRFGIKILGGCCGTGLEHLQYIVNNIHSEQVATPDSGTASLNRR